MLQSLTIKNIAVIDASEIPFKQGLNILSGETGAGKSIVIEAISLLLGSRANTELIRAGCDEALVQGLFDISDIPWIQPRLEKLGLDSGGSELLVRRTISRNGRHRIHINGEAATLSILEELCSGLVDLCGQHEHQSLIRPATQLELLDRYGGLTEQAKLVAASYARAAQLSAELKELQETETERAKKADFLSFQIEELRSAKLDPGEDDRLQKEKQLLQSAEVRAKLADAIRDTLESEQYGALGALRSAQAKLRSLVQMDDATRPYLEGLERAIAETEETAISLNRYLTSSELDPDRLTEVQERLSQLADLRRKYGAQVSDMLATLEKLDAEFSSLGQVGQRLGQLTSEVEQAREKLLKEGRKLSQSRRKIAGTLADSVTGELKDLKMGEAQFRVELHSRGDSLSELDRWSSSGADDIQFVVQTNKGEEPRPLGKIASGGELSRLMLAIRRVIADRGGIGVYLFDEIDAGIGGQTAFQVGKKLKSVAAYNQVICITHLPQVASFADHHLVVRKAVAGKRTATEVVELAQKERKEELARMLGGPELTRKSLDNAAELLQLAQR
jgi:DNA repair protein RecN (Recombination protein N)